LQDFGRNIHMRRLLTLLALVAMLAAPTAMHADTILNGQFSIQGTLINTGTTLNFAQVGTGFGTQTGSFATLLSDNQGVTGAPVLTYSPFYIPGSEVLTTGSLTVDLETFVETAAGVFSGTAVLSAPGFLDTNATFSLTAPMDKGPVMFSATVATPATPAVPEPATFALLGTGILGLAGAVRRKLGQV
jgi:hypothetical protein